MPLAHALNEHSVGTLDLTHFVTADESVPVRDVVCLMRRHDRTTVLVTREGRLTGIFTERDLLNRVLPGSEALGAPIARVMTPNPTTVRTDTPVREALRLMREGRFRDLPVVAGDGRIQGNVTDNCLVQHLADHLQAEVLNLPPDPNQMAETVEGA